MGAKVNAMDTSTLHKLKTRPAIRPTKALIHPYGSKAPLPLRGVINITVVSAKEDKYNIPCHRKRHWKPARVLFF